MRRLLVLSFTALVCLLTVVPSELPAADGAIPIWEPTTITEPGKYVLTRSIVVGEAGILVIASSNVTLDLDGFTVEREGAPGSCISAFGEVIDIRNGVLSGCSVDGYMIDSGVYDLTIHNGGIVNQQVNFNIEDNVINGGGISLDDASNVTVRRNTLNDSPGNGLYAYNCLGCTIVDNTISDAAGDGIEIGSGESITIENNRIYGCDGVRIPSSEVHVKGNTLLSNAGYGLRFLPSSESINYGGNVARSNRGSGTDCANPAASTDFCDEGTNNTSLGDNYMPGQM